MTDCAELASQSTRDRLIQAAREAFMSEGYRASMDGIAARAGVAKQTLYNHFPSKEELFGEIACAASADIVVTLEGSTENVRESLLLFACTFCGRALGEEGLAMFRALTAEGLRFPEMAQTFFARGPNLTVGRLADFLGRAMRDGRIRDDDPQFAAEMLIGMLLGVDHARRLCLVACPDFLEKERISRIVDCFLRAFAAPC